MSAPPQIYYARETGLSTAEFRRVLVASGLGQHRPVADDARLAAMLSGASLILTARRDDAHGELLGVARCITDFAWCAYVSELAVTAAAQGLSIGKNLLLEARRLLGPGVSLILISVPEARGFYERMGMQQVQDAFWFHRDG